MYFFSTCVIKIQTTPIPTNSHLVPLIERHYGSRPLRVERTTRFVFLTKAQTIRAAERKIRKQRPSYFGNGHFPDTNPSSPRDWQPDQTAKFGPTLSELILSDGRRIPALSNLDEEKLVWEPLSA